VLKFPHSAYQARIPPFFLFMLRNYILSPFVVANP